MASYSMGQYKTSDSSSDYLVNVNRDYGYEESSASIGDNSESTNVFRDPYIVATDADGFKAGNIYYLKIPILKNQSYECVYDIKLIDSDNTKYQFLRRVTVPKGGTGTGFSDVVLLQYGTDDDGNSLLAAGIPKHFGTGIDENGEEQSLPSSTEDNPIPEGDIYYIADDDSIGSGSDRTYYYFDGTQWINVGEKFNDQAISLTWLYGSTTDESNYYNFELIFKSVQDFNKILIEKIRDIEDYNFSYEVEDDSGNVSTYFGLKTEIYESGIILSSVNNVLSSGKINKSSLNKIGIWSHPNAMFSINGQEMHVGYNGYYELSCDDIDVNITHLGLIVNDSTKDKFLIDYEYAIS